MERLGDKLDQVKLDRSSQARFAPYQQLHLGACLGEAAFLVVRLPIRLTGLQARRTEPSHPEPPHCREAAQRASENSFALLEGTQKIALITPGSVTARKHVQCTKSQGMQWSGCGLHLYDNTTLHFKPRFTQKPIAAAAKYQSGLFNMSSKAWLSRMAGHSTTATPAMSHTKQAGASMNLDVSQQRQAQDSLG
ncbi:TPA: hypothetical protein ACH3X1_003083 [Trebouxia sp. C0004]